MIAYKLNTAIIMQFLRTGIGLFLTHYFSQIALVLICVNTIKLKEIPQFEIISFEAVLIAPVEETIFYQFIPKLILDMLGIRNYWVVLLSMTVLFTSVHNIHSIQENIMFSVMFITINALLINYYLQVQKQETTINAIVKTIILHSLYNLTLDIIDFIVSLFS